MIEKLIELMKSQEKYLKQLLELLIIQKELIMKKDAFALEGLVDKLNECSKKIAREEVARRNLLNDESLKEFIYNSNNVELSNTHSEIVNIINKVILQKDTNEMLLKQQIGLNAKVLNMMNPNREMRTYNSYGNLSK